MADITSEGGVQFVHRFRDMGDGTHAEVMAIGGEATVSPSPALAAADDVDAPAVNTAAVITYGAVAGTVHVLGGVAWSYDDDPTGGNLQITAGGAVVFEIDITTGGPGFIPFDPPKRGAAGEAVVITLAAAGAAVAGKVNALSHWTE